MASQRKFYRTVIQVEVLSEEPVTVGSLHDLGDAITTVDYSGQLTALVLNEEVDGPTMACLLQAQRSDAAFFMLTEDGSDLDDD
jgi:hypothetical protein